MLIGKGILDSLRENNTRVGLVAVPVGVGTGQTVILRMAAAHLQGFIIVVHVTRVIVDDLRAVDGGLLHRRAALAEGMGVDDEDLVVKLVVKLLGAHAAGVRVGAEPLLVDAVDQVVVVIFREPELSTQYDVQAHLVAPLLGGMVAGEVVVHHLVPVVLRVDTRQVLGVKVVRYHQAGKAVAYIAVHHIGGKQMAALAGFRSMGMRIVQIAVHMCSLPFHAGARLSPGIPLFQILFSARQVLRLIRVGISI